MVCWRRNTRNPASRCLSSRYLMSRNHWRSSAKRSCNWKFDLKVRWCEPTIRTAASHLPTFTISFSPSARNITLIICPIKKPAGTIQYHHPSLTLPTTAVGNPVIYLQHEVLIAQQTYAACKGESIPLPSSKMLVSKVKWLMAVNSECATGAHGRCDQKPPLRTVLVPL